MGKRDAIPVDVPARPLASRLKMIAAATVAGLLGLGALTLALYSAHATGVAHRVERAYDTAAACPADSPDDADCVHADPATVTGYLPAGERRGQSGFYATYPNHLWTILWLSSQSDLAHALKVGDPVTLTSWQGDVVAVSGRGHTQTTETAPSSKVASELALTLEMCGFGLLLLPPSSVLFAAQRVERLKTGPMTMFACTASVFSGLVLLFSGAGLASGVSLGLNTVITAVLLVAALFGAGSIAWRMSARAEP